MVEKINLPIKISGDTLSAIEFNQVVDKTNSLITEFNSATTLSQVTWIIGQPKPTIVADEIIGTISEGETKYVQTSTVGNQTIAILHSPNSVLSDTVTQSFPLNVVNNGIPIQPIADGYFIMRNNPGSEFNYELCYLNNNVVAVVDLTTTDENLEFGVSEMTSDLQGVCTNEHMICMDDGAFSCIIVVDRSTNMFNESLSIKATNLLMSDNMYITMFVSDGLSNLYALGTTSDNEYATDFDVVVIKLNSTFDIISTRTLATILSSSPETLQCRSISLIDNYMYETSFRTFELNSELLVKRYNLTTNSYDETFGNTLITRITSSNDLVTIDQNIRKLLIKSGIDLYYVNGYMHVDNPMYLHTVKLIDTGTDVELIEPSGLINDYAFNLATNVYSIQNALVICQISADESGTIKQTVMSFANGAFIDITENFDNADLLINGISLQNDKYAIFGLSKSVVLASIANNTFGGTLITDTILLTDLSFNPNITVTSVSDYYAKALDYYQAIVSPGDIYIPNDLRTAYVSSIMVVNGNSIYKYNNETEELVTLEVPGLDNSWGVNAFNDIIQVITQVDPNIANLYSVNEDLSVTDLTSWFTQQELDGLDISKACYINGAIYSTSVTPDVNGNYMITKRTATDVTTLSLQIEMTGASGMTEIRMQKLDANHIALWNPLVESPLSMFIVDAILEIGDSVTFTTYTTLVGDKEVYPLSINWMHDYPNIAGCTSELSQGVIFPSDAVSQAYTDIATPISALVGERSWNLHAILDSEDRKIVMLVFDEQFGVFDFDTMSPLTVTFDDVVNPIRISSQVGNILHQKSDGTFMYFQPNSGQVFTSSDLATWTLITPSKGAN